MDHRTGTPKRPLFAATGEVRYEEALGHIDDHFAILDHEWRYVFINARAAEILGRPAGELVGHSIWDLFPDTPVVLDGDMVRLAQVLANLLNNAAKYTPGAGRIEVSARTDAESVVLRVRDNGIGIPPELLPRVFDLFAQADRSPSRTEGGLGVGLTLVRSLVEMHGGSVKIKSEGAGEGTEAVVRLPRQTNTADTPDPSPQSPEASARRRILLVDDNVDSAESLGLLLELNGHEVRVAFDGPSGIEAARAFHPQVALLDIGLPGMDGYELARRIRAELDGVLLVALTGYGQESDRRRSAEAGFDHHLVKPVDISKLEAVLG